MQEDLRHTFELAQGDYARTWSGVDEALYALARDYPGHSDIRHVAAKVLIIGRTFSTGLERHIYSDGTLGSSASKAAQHFQKHAGEIDDVVARVSRLKPVWMTEQLPTILRAHHDLTHIVSGTTRGTVPRSFASKYLHFHAPAVPIYDNVSYDALRSRYPARSLNEEYAALPQSDAYDEGYYDHIVRMGALHRELVSLGFEAATVRQMEFTALYLT